MGFEPIRGNPTATFDRTNILILGWSDSLNLNIAINKMQDSNLQGNIFQTNSKSKTALY